MVIKYDMVIKDDGRVQKAALKSTPTKRGIQAWLRMAAACSGVRPALSACSSAPGMARSLMKPTQRSPLKNHVTSGHLKSRVIGITPQQNPRLRSHEQQAT